MSVVFLDSRFIVFYICLIESQMGGGGVRRYIESVDRFGTEVQKYDT